MIGESEVRANGNRRKMRSLLFARSSAISLVDELGRAVDKNEPIILIAASGVGIQSAA